ncbi:MAG TPA: FAD-dependent oxidoreductase, partial [Sulfurimonas sp.]|nr:FAD-dependent oxidoreductase [Sulfurimonas sp.]
LKELIEEAYLYSLCFYEKNFLEHTTLSPLLHISKYENDNEKVEYFKKHTKLEIKDLPSSLKNKLKPHALNFSSVYLQNNAVIEPKEICEAMLKGIELRIQEVKQAEFIDGIWEIDGIKAKNIVLCTGAYEEVFKQEYISLRRIYGQRCEIQSSTIMKESIHQDVSISVTKKNGCIAIGASHYLDVKEIPSDEEGAKSLLELAQKSFELEDVKVHNVLTGMRAGSNDYLPIIGPMVDMTKSLEHDASALKGNKNAKLSMIDNVYMINGVGGYGFVLAPYLAKMMCDYLVDDKPLAEYLEPKRFYYRIAKKKGLR